MNIWISLCYLPIQVAHFNFSLRMPDDDRKGRGDSHHGCPINKLPYTRKKNV